VLNFITATCDAVQEDLTDFFVKSGYLMPIDIDIDDYGVQHITITQPQIDALISSIQTKGYPKPVSPVLNYISVNTLNAYKNRAQMTGNTNVGVTANTSTLTIDNSKWANAVAFETYNQQTLTDVAIYGTGDATSANSKTTVQYATGSTSVYAVGYDGSKKLVYPAVDVATTLGINAINTDAEGKNNVVIYPNPIKDALHIKLKENNGPKEVQVFDINGRMLLNQKINGNDQVINVSQLAGGLYFVKIKAANGTVATMKITKAN